MVDDVLIMFDLRGLNGTLKRIKIMSYQTVNNVHREQYDVKFSTCKVNRLEWFCDRGNGQEAAIELKGMGFPVTFYTDGWPRAYIDLKGYHSTSLWRYIYKTYGINTHEVKCY